MSGAAESSRCKICWGWSVRHLLEFANAVIREIVEAHLAVATPEQKARLLELGRLAITKGALSSARTGVVIAGFGTAELFPTLISCEVDGMVCGRLKFVPTNHVDIDRKGPKAQVIPFAQKEMVERFLYGLDEDIQRQIGNFCKVTVPAIREKVLSQIDLEQEEDKAALVKDAEEAEAAFVKGLNEKAFAKIRDRSRAEIDDMVEFMPKPEMAKMAEALVNLTSIKRRVSRGMETVGGPIDVAVISQSEGFVWIKRKHYFPNELNPRYFERLRAKELRHGQGPKPRRAGAARGGKGARAKPAVVEGFGNGAKETAGYTRAFEHGSRKKLLGRIKVAEDA